MGRRIENSDRKRIRRVVAERRIEQLNFIKRNNKEIVETMNIYGNNHKMH